MTQQYDVTSVGVNPAKDRAYRMRTYFITMTIRVLCVVSLFWVRGYWVILAAVGAIVLPYVAVLIANAVSHVSGQAPAQPSPLALSAPEGSGNAETAGATDSDHVIVIDAPAERRASKNGSTE